MHMTDALLSPAVGASFWAGTLAALGFASRRLKATLDDRLIPLMGVLGAFIFAAQMVNFTIPGTGSSGHLGGGLVLAVIVGPSAAFLVMASVLTVQALFFADGGLLALGCNIWNLGIYPGVLAYLLLYRPIAGQGAGTRRVLFAAIISAVAGLQLGSLSVVLQTVLSGKSELPFTAFLLVMQPIHLAIGIAEGLVTAAVINYVRHARPEILELSAAQRPLPAGLSLRKVLTVFALTGLLLAGVLSWFASNRPDGLEWSIEQVTAGAGLREQEQGAAGALGRVQERTAVLPDYGFRPTGSGPDPGQGTTAWPGMDAGTSVAGIVGSALVLIAVVLIGIGIRTLRRRRA